MEFLEGFLQAPVHPVFVHFPVGLLVSALILELASHFSKMQILHQAAIVVYVLAACFLPLTVLTGWLEANHLHLRHPVLDAHARFAFITLWGVLVSLPVLWFVRQRSAILFEKLFLIFLIVFVATVIGAAYYGGHLVYQYGVGVKS